jgi:hypothetical protein
MGTYMMEPNDVLTLRETWAAECHADAPKGACCCCYRTNHHQHQVKTGALQAENDRLREAIKENTFHEQDEYTYKCLPGCWRCEIGIE